MVECSHLSLSVILTLGEISEVKPEQWCCTVCRSKKSPWICLACGLVHCGRYVSGHAKRHSQMCPGHLLCMDQSLSVFCYKDDEFVVNDNLIINQLRAHIQKRLEPSQGLPTSSDRDADPPPSKIPRRVGSHPIRTGGLANLGNTCFMNSILQSLNNLEQFYCFFKKIPSFEVKGSPEKQLHRYHTRQNGDTDEVSLVDEMRKVSCALWQKDTGVHSPDSLFTVLWRLVPRFRGYQQQDAHEFMRYLLDKLHTELMDMRRPWNKTCQSKSSPSSSSSSSSSIISKLFGGTLQSDVSCLSCKNESQKLDPILDISLDLPKAVTKKDECSLMDCLQCFTECEILQNSEWYHCASCKSRQPSTKQLSLHTLPNVLCIHLKRFHFTSFSRIKLTTLVHFPVHHLDMGPYTATPTASKVSGHKLYDLAAIVVHHGAGVTCGHYTAYTFSPQSGSWYHFNDRTVTECKLDQVLTQQAYILFYMRRTMGNGKEKYFSSSTEKVDQATTN